MWLKVGSGTLEAVLNAFLPTAPIDWSGRLCRLGVGAEQPGSKGWYMQILWKSCLLQGTSCQGMMMMMMMMQGDLLRTPGLMDLQMSDWQ